MNIIKTYLEEDKTDSALLIKGKWGSGKTHFYNNVVRQQILKYDLVPIYISVYGRKSTTELKNAIMSEFLLQKFKKINHDKKDKKTRTSKVKQAKKLDQFGIDKNELGTMLFESAINGVIKKGIDEINKLANMDMSLSDIFSDFNKIVLVVDDFERSRIDIIELMGNVFRLIEEESIKTIIIANEEEIENTLIENNELKIATSISALTYNNRNDKQKEDTSKDILTELNNMKSMLFNDQYHYIKMKEKLIGYTIDVNQNVSEVVDIIFDNLIKNEKSVLFQNKELIVEIFIRSGYNNFRLLNRALKLLSVLEDEIDLSAFTDTTAINKSLCNYLLMGVIQYIETKITDNEDNRISKLETQDLGFIYGVDYPKIILTIYNNYRNLMKHNKLIFFSSIQRLITSYTLDEKNVKADLEMLYHLYLPISLQEDPLLQIVNFRFLETDKINELSNAVIENIRSGKYNSLDYEKALRILLFFTENRLIKISQENILSIFEEFIPLINNGLNQYGVLRGNSMSYSIENDKFQEIVKRTKRELDNYTKATKIEFITSAFEKLGAEFDSSIEELSNLYVEDNSLLFYSYIAPELVLEKIAQIEEEKYYYFFIFLRDRTKFISTEEEQYSYKLFQEFITSKREQLFGLKYFYLKDFFIENL